MSNMFLFVPAQRIVQFVISFLSPPPTQTTNQYKQTLQEKTITSQSWIKWIVLQIPHAN